MMASFSLETTLELTQAMSWLPHIHSGEEQLRLAWTFASLKHRLDSTVDWLAAKTRRKQCKICSSALKIRVRALLYWFAGARRCWGGGSGATRSQQKNGEKLFLLRISLEFCYLGLKIWLFSILLEYFSTKNTKFGHFCLNLNCCLLKSGYFAHFHVKMEGKIVQYGWWTTIRLSVQRPQLDLGHFSRFISPLLILDWKSISGNLEGILDVWLF